MWRKLTNLMLGLALVGTVVGCDDDGATGPGATPGTGTASLSFAVMGGGTAPAPGLFAAGLELTDGSNTLVIESAELVLREIEFERVEDLADCDESGSDDICEKIESGPFLVALPLDGSVTKQLTVQIDTGTFDEIEFDIHKVDDDDPANAEFLSLHPNFADISLRVTGTWNGQDFLFTSDLNEEQELELADPLVVTEDSGPVNVTLMIDLSIWFRAAGDVLIDPRTAVKGEPNEDPVKENIRNSIEGFRDDDEDGVPHGDDDDEADD